MSAVLARPISDDAVSRLRVPPHSNEAEQSVLGALLQQDPTAFGRLDGLLQVQEFYSAGHRWIFEAIAWLSGEREPIDVITVHERMRVMGRAEDAGGLAYLNALAQSVPSSRNLESYARTVRQQARLRALIAASDNLATAAFNSQDREALASAQQEMQASIAAAASPTNAAPSAKPMLLDLRGLAARKAPDRHWPIPGWLGFDPTLFAAAGGVGKTLLAQQTATELAIGRSFAGEVERPYRSMLLACEDDAEELWRRQERISDHLVIGLGEPAENLILQTRRGCDSVLMAPDRGELRRTTFYEDLRQQVNDLGVEVLWLDNVAHVFAGDEINRGQVTQFINAMAGLVTGRPFAVVLLAHTARQAGSEFSGSAAWENAVRMRWYLGTKLPDQKADDDEAGTEAADVRYLARRKSNYSRKDCIRFTMHGGVLVPDEQPAGHVSGVVRAIDERQAEDAALAAFRALHGMGISTSDKSNSQDYLPKQAAAKGLAGGFTARDLGRAVDRLLTRGIFRRGVVGRYSNRSPKEGLVLAQEAAS
jgi:DnaB-like helicase N terminal domain/AAA domain